MAVPHEERTEQPTPRRRREARTKGQVARSQDLTAAVLLLVAFVGLRFLGPGLWNTLTAMTAGFLSDTGPPDIARTLTMAGMGLIEVARHLVPLLLMLFVAMLLVLLMQVGLLFTWQPLVPSLGRINPLKGLQRLFSIRSLMLGVINFGKLLAVGASAWLVLASGAAAVIFALTFGFHDVFRLGSSMVFSLGIKLGAVLLVLALLDLAWQRYKHERDMRMTKEEVKEEFRNMEGDPHIKRRRRQIQHQLAMQKLRQEVPQADVVVTNPTHLAVAIRYDAEAMAAPKVVAKGADYLALRIRQIAQAHGVPVIERKPLARALYESVEVGEYVPERFYRAIAEILAYVYELTGRSPLATAKA